jgi:trk system potassium uptake protein TrkH
VQAGLATLGIATGAGGPSTPALPAAAELVVILTAVTGGMVASPSGGITAYRAMVLLKSVGRELRRLLHPKAVIPLRLGPRVIPEESVLAIIAFFFTFVTAWILGAGLLAILEPGLGLVASASGALAALSNVAFGFGALAAPDGYAHLHLASQAVLTALMWLGRLEIFAALLVFLPSTWRN